MAAIFNGSSTYLSGTPVAPLGALDRGVGMWFRAADPTTRGVLWSEGDDSTSWSRFMIEVGNTSGKVSFNYGGGAFDSTTTIAADTWYHVFANMATSSVGLYINGVLENSHPDVYVTPTGTFNIGRYNGGALYHNGYLAEVVKYNLALGSADIAGLGKGACPLRVRPQAIVFYAPLVRAVFDHKGLALTNNGPTTVGVHPRIFV